MVVIASTLNLRNFCDLRYTYKTKKYLVVVVHLVVQTVRQEKNLRCLFMVCQRGKFRSISGENRKFLTVNIIATEAILFLKGDYVLEKSFALIGAGLTLCWVPSRNKVGWLV